MKEVKQLLQICIKNVNGFAAIDSEKLAVVLDELKKSKPYLLHPLRAEIKRFLLLNTIKVTSSYPLGNSQKSEIERKFKGAMYEYVVDKDILGGLIVQIGDTVYDNSLTTKINQIN